MLPSLLCGEFLLYIPSCLHFYLGSFTHTMLASFYAGSFSCTSWADFLFYVGSFSYTSRAGFLFSRGSFSYISCAGFTFMWGVSLIHPMLASFLSGEFFLHIPCWLHLYLGSFSYTSHTDFLFLWGVSLTHPVLSHFYPGSFSCTSCAVLIFMEGVSLTHPMLPSFSFDLGSFSYTSCADFNFFNFILFPFFLFLFLITGVSLTHPVLVSFLSEVFLLHIPCWLQFYLGSFSYTSRAGILFNFIFIFSGHFLWHIPCWFPFFIGIVCLPHLLAAHLSGVSFFFFFFFIMWVSWFAFLSLEIFLHIPYWLHISLGSFPCWLPFYLRIFSYTSSAGFILTGEFLLHILY